MTAAFYNQSLYLVLKNKLTNDSNIVDITHGWQNRNVSVATKKILTIKTVFLSDRVTHFL